MDIRRENFVSSWQWQIMAMENLSSDVASKKFTCDCRIPSSLSQMISCQLTCHFSDLREQRMSEMCKTWMKMDMQKKRSELIFRRRFEDNDV